MSTFENHSYGLGVPFSNSFNGLDGLNRWSEWFSI
jgi:hypothetical protein